MLPVYPYRQGGKAVGYFGIVNKRSCRRHSDIDNEVYYADFNWKELLNHPQCEGELYGNLQVPAETRLGVTAWTRKCSLREIEKIAYETEKSC